MEQFIFDSAIRWYHFYQYVWKAAAGEKLHAEQEFDSPMDKFAVKVKKKKKMKSLAICLTSTHEYLGIFLHMVERYASKLLAAGITANSFVEK